MRYCEKFCWLTRHVRAACNFCKVTCYLVGNQKTAYGNVTQYIYYKGTPTDIIWKGLEAGRKVLRGDLPEDVPVCEWIPWSINVPKGIDWEDKSVPKDY